MIRKGLQILLLILSLSLLSYIPIVQLISVLSTRDLLHTFDSLSSSLDAGQLEEQKRLATEYNEAIFEMKRDGLLFEEKEILSQYENILDVGNGMMARISIPCIDMDLPVYHSESEQVLSFAVGHHKLSSFPIGGLNTRAVFSGHSGLANHRIFTRLDELETGDWIELRVLDEILYYRVCEIEVVEPNQVEAIAPKEGQDLITLITCTPYGINTHRLLVTATRSDPPISTILTRKSGSWHELLLTSLIFVVPGIIIIFISRKIKVYRRRKKYKRYKTYLENY